MTSTTQKTIILKRCEGLGILERKVLESVRGKEEFRMWLCAQNRVWRKALKNVVKKF